MMKLEEAAAFFKLKLLSSEFLIALANEYLQAKIESPSLVILAGLNNPEYEEVRKLFEKSLLELQTNIPDANKAVSIVARYYAMQICLREISPYEGAKAIWWDAENQVENRDDLKIFVAAASEIEDLSHRYSDNPEIARKYILEWEEAIMQAAEKLVMEKV